MRDNEAKAATMTTLYAAPVMAMQSVTGLCNGANELTACALERKTPSIRAKMIIRTGWLAFGNLGGLSISSVDCAVW